MGSLRVEALRAAIEELAHLYRIRLAVLFGSLARGEANKLSDVDLAVLCDCDILELAEELERRG
ncbi:MAG: nucleotidyltransferase domain-containing protein [Candidatus Korarchaeota archaeon]|nr:nucleotidyltransferase domain-containing protein [Candidatus Korarchaeota archaeon]